MCVCVCVCVCDSQANFTREQAAANDTHIPIVILPKSAESALIAGELATLLVHGVEGSSFLCEDMSERGESAAHTAPQEFAGTPNGHGEEKRRKSEDAFTGSASSADRDSQRDRETGSDTERGTDPLIDSPQPQTSRVSGADRSLHSSVEHPSVEGLKTHTDTETARDTQRERLPGLPNQAMSPSWVDAASTAAMLQSSAAALEARCQQLLNRVQTLEHEKSHMHNQVCACVCVCVCVCVFNV